MKKITSIIYNHVLGSIPRYQSLYSDPCNQGYDEYTMIR